MTSRFQAPPCVKASERLLLDIEQAVRKFPRYHRYQIGADLRRAAGDAYRLANRACRDRAHRRRVLEELVWKVDELNQHLQIAKMLHATKSFRQFEHLARQVSNLGAQARGWRDSQPQDAMHPNGQNAQGDPAVAQRAEKLSTHAASASAGANP